MPPDFSYLIWRAWHERRCVVRGHMWQRDPEAYLLVCQRCGRVTLAETPEQFMARKEKKK